MKTKWFIVCGILVILCGCTPNRKEDIPIESTTPLPNENNIDKNKLIIETRRMPLWINCTKFQDGGIGVGTTWESFTIGVSTREEIEKVLGSPLNVDQTTNAFEYQNPVLNGEWKKLEACFTENRLIGLNVFHPRNFPLTPEDWVAQYSNPDIVTWADDPYTRTLVWAEEGILAAITYHWEYMTRNVIMFPPINREDISNSWIVEVLPQKRIGEIAPDVPPPHDEKDPWNIER